MGLYPMTSLELLCQQIERDNPEVRGLVNPNSIMVMGTPLTNVPAATKRNTRIKLNGHLGNGFMGRREFFYDRLDLGRVFNGITVVFEATSTSVKYADLLPALNEQYGLGLEPQDISNGETLLTYGYEPTPVVLNIDRYSLAYTGSLSVVWKRTPAGVYPDSGPGTKTMVIGDMNAGYFGVVKQEEMFTPAQFFDIINEEFKDTGITPVFNANLYWIKFALDGEFYFFPSATVGVNATWKALDGVHAVKPDGPYPWTGKDNTGKRLFFQLELPRAATADPMINVRNDPGSVSARIFNKLHSAGYGNKEWDNLTFDMGNSFVWLNHYIYGNDPEAVFNSQMNQATVGGIKDTTIANWRPMIRIVDGKLSLVPMRTLITEPQGVVIPPAMSIDQRRDPSIPLSVINFLATYNREIDVPVMRIAPTLRADSIQAVKDVLGTLLMTIDKPVASTPVAVPVRPPRNTSIQSNLMPIQVTVTPIIRAKTKLGNLNGELNGFK